MATRLRKAAIIGMFIVVATLSVCAWLYGPRSWTDVADRNALPSDSQRVFSLLIALHAPGRPASNNNAQQICRWLGWPRCDREALEEVGSRTRPPGRGWRGSQGSNDGQVAAARAIADATWALGSEDAVRKMFRVELDRIPESEGPTRARVFVRFGIIETNPDGQAALFAQACVADPAVCELDRLRQAAQREVQARFVPPGNVLPLFFGGHPPVAGKR